MPLQRFDIEDLSGKSSVHTLEQVDISAGERTRWDEVRAAVMFVCPAFTHILYTMMNNSKSPDIAFFTKSKFIPTAATDGSNLIINVDYFFALELREQVFVVVHEILHAMFNHCGQGYQFRKFGRVVTASGQVIPYVHEIMNFAQDLVINDLLINAKIGKFKQEWIWNPAIGTENDSSVDVYERIANKSVTIPKGGCGKSFDMLLPPGASTGDTPTEANSKRSEDEWRDAITAGKELAKSRGMLPANIERVIDKLLEPEVNWSDHIQALFNRKIGSDGTSWRTPDRRFIIRDCYVPGRTGHRAGTIVVGFDSSGSIYADPTLLDRFSSEIGGMIADVNPQRLIVVWCDAAVQRVDEVDELTDIAGLKIVGGGGTRFEPVFDWIAENVDDPDALIYLTDGEGSFPKKAPTYPVIWGNITPGKTYPFGDVVNIPTRSKAKS